MYRKFIIIFISLHSFISVFAQTNKNNTLLDTSLIAETLFFIPNGMECNFKADTSRITLHPNGDVYRWSKNVISGIDNGANYTFPQNFSIGAVCWTNSGNLIIFSNDTLYQIDSTMYIRPIVEIRASKVKLYAVGDNDVAFCMMGGKKIFRTYIGEEKTDEVISFKSAVRDFFVYDDAYFIAIEREVVAYKETKNSKKEIVPIFSNSGPIYKIALCGTVGLFMVDDIGLWYINEKLQKMIVINKYVSNIQSNMYDKGYFLLPNNIWMYLSPISLFNNMK